jgi:soluble lytic murein transglycosylase-like protein
LASKPLLVALSLPLLCGLGTGCTTSDLITDASVSAQDTIVYTLDDPELPESVVYTPHSGDGMRATLSAAAQNAPQDQPAEPPVEAVAFAGPTPDNPAIAAFGEGPRQVAARSPELDALIARYAAHYELPVELVRRVVQRESTFNPAARNGPYWGLMQIRHDTARTMGYRGSAEGLLDAETNLRYAVRYLRGAYITAGGNHDQAVRFYSRGYYYDAKRKGLLRETGLRS